MALIFGKQIFSCVFIQKKTFVTFVNGTILWTTYLAFESMMKKINNEILCALDFVINLFLLIFLLQLSYY